MSLVLAVPLVSYVTMLGGKDPATKPNSKKRPRRSSFFVQEQFPEIPEKNSTKFDLVCEELRDLQWTTNCSNLTLQTFLNSLRGNLGRLVRELDELPTDVTYADKKMQTMVCNFSLILLLHNVCLLYVSNKHNNSNRPGQSMFACMVVQAPAVTKSGNKVKQGTRATNVIRLGTMPRDIPRNLLFGSR